MNISTKIINEINNIGNKYGDVKKICLFGSRARGDHHSRSDIDLAIYFFNKPNQKVVQELETIDTLLKIDVTTIHNGLEKNFLNNVKNEGVCIYSTMHVFQ